MATSPNLSPAEEGSAAHKCAELLGKGLPLPAQVLIQESAHYELSASKAGIWGKCPAFLRTVRATPPRKIPPDGGRKMADVDDDMRRHAAGFVAYCSDLPGKARFVEREIPPGFFDKLGLVGGSADFVCATKGEALHVVDFKYGAGHAVSAVENWQLLIYGLPLAVNSGCESLTLHIVQPRSVHGAPISQWTVPRDLWDAWTRTISAAAARNVAALKKSGDATPGEHCHWCPKTNCKEYRAKIYEIARADFSPPADPDEKPRWTDPAEMSPDQIVAALYWMPQIESTVKEWCSAVRARAVALAGDGKLPGQKLVAGRAGNRKWDDPAVAAAALDALGIDPWEPREVVSPAVAEKRGIDPRAIARLASQAPGAVSVAPISDPRPAIEPRKSAADDFVQDSLY